MELTPDQVWQNCLSFIKDNINQQSFETWFLPIHPVKFKKSISTFVAIFEVPAFPGIQIILLENLDSSNFSHKACSLPPLPNNAIFI